MATQKDQSEVAVFVQINDFYHIDSSTDPARPDSMVLPRVATVLQRIRQQYGAQRVWFCLPGDFLNPACLSRTHRSRQMIDIFNRLGLDIVCFGNHEFDFNPDHFTVADLLERIDESDFTWLASNLDADPLGGDAFLERSTRLRDVYEMVLSPRHSIYIFGLLYESEYKGFGKFKDPVGRCRRLIERTKRSYAQRHKSYRPARTTFVALTHQDLSDDLTLAQEVPDLHLIMGGHDHEVLEKALKSNCLVVKSKSNARTLRLNAIVWVPKANVQRFIENFGSVAAACNEQIIPGTLTHLINVSLTGHFEVPASIDRSDPDIVAYMARTYGPDAADKPGAIVHQYNDDGIVVIVSIVLDTFHPAFEQLVPPEQETARLIRQWLDASPEHREVLLRAPVLLETSDEACRSRSTNFGNFVADVISGRLRRRKPHRVKAAVGLVNGGSFRLNRDIVKDEAITKGVICDLLFHPNDVRMYKMPGSCLEDILRRAHSKFRNHGNFIQISGLEVEASASSLRIQVEAEGKLAPLEPAKVYSVATTSYLATSEDAYGDLFGPLGPPDIIESSVKDAVESELLSEGLASVFDDSRRWR